MLDVDRVAGARRPVKGRRCEFIRTRDIGRGGHVFLEAHQLDVGVAQAALAHATAGDERGGVVHPLHQPRAETVEHAGENEDVGGVDEGAVAGSEGCFGSGLAIGISLRHGGG